jgi:hypothetical protein
LPPARITAYMLLPPSKYREIQRNRNLPRLPTESDIALEAHTNASGLG